MSIIDNNIDDIDEPRFEYRFHWSASTNISFKGTSDWSEYGGFAENVEEVETEMNRHGHVPDALSEVLSESGFEWEVEVRHLAVY